MVKPTVVLSQCENCECDLGDGETVPAGSVVISDSCNEELTCTCVDCSSPLGELVHSGPFECPEGDICDGQGHCHGPRLYLQATGATVESLRWDWFPQPVDYAGNTVPVTSFTLTFYNSDGYILDVLPGYTDNSFEATDLLPASMYILNVDAINDIGDVVVTETAGQPTRPTHVTNLRMSNQDGDYLTFTWDRPVDCFGDPLDVDHYKVFLASADQYLREDMVSSSQNEITWGISDLAKGVVYAVDVFSVYERELGLADSFTFSINPFGAALQVFNKENPKKVSKLKETKKGENSLKVEWEVSDSDFDDYVLEIVNCATKSKSNVTVNKGVSCHEFTGLTPGSYKVTMYTRKGDCLSEGVKIGTGTVIPMPTSVSVKRDGAKYKISWDPPKNPDNTDFNAENIEVTIKCEGENTIKKTLPGNSKCYRVDLPWGKECEIKVKAVQGDQSSAVAYGTKPANSRRKKRQASSANFVPPVTDLVLRHSTSGSLKMAWSEPIGCDGGVAFFDHYIITVTNLNDGTTMDYDINSEHCINITGLDPGTPYSVSVKVYRGGVGSPLTVIQANTEPEDPDDKEVSVDEVTHSSITVSWPTKPGATYRVFLVKADPIEIVDEVDPATSPVTFDNLDPDTTYSVIVQELCPGEDRWFTFSTLVTTEEEPPPKQVTINKVTDTTVNVSWDTKPNAVYRVILLNADTLEIVERVYPATPPIVFEGLEPRTRYSVIVQELCPGEALWTTFSTIFFTEKEEKNKISVDEVTSTSIKVSWTTKPGAVYRAFLINVKTLDIVDQKNPATPPVTFGGLDPKTKYMVIVQELCPGETRWRTYSQTVKTKRAPKPPKLKITVSDINKSSAKVSWPTKPGCVYRAFLIKVSAIQIVDKKDPATPPITFDDLESKTEYLVIVQELCPGEAIWRTYSKKFKTK